MPCKCARLGVKPINITEDGELLMTLVPYRYLYTDYMKIKFLCLLLLISCSSKFNPRKANTYNQHINQDISRTLVFYTDGSYHFKQDAKMASYYSQGTWVKQDLKLCLNTNEEYRFFNHKLGKSSAQDTLLEVIVKDDNGYNVEGVTVQLGADLIGVTDFNGLVILPYLNRQNLTLEYLDNKYTIIPDLEKHNKIEVTINFQKINTIEFTNDIFIDKGLFLISEELGVFKLKR